MARRVLPMQLQVGDHFTDEEGVWEVADHPFTTRQGKLVHATIRKPGDPASTREKTWPAYERLSIERAGPAPAPEARPRSRRPAGRRARGRA